jgi:hypothetical protein
MFILWEMFNFQIVRVWCLKLILVNVQLAILNVQFSSCGSGVFEIDFDVYFLGNVQFSSFENGVFEIDFVNVQLAMLNVQFSSYESGVSEIDFKDSIFFESLILRSLKLIFRQCSISNVQCSIFKL